MFYLEIKIRINMFELRFFKHTNVSGKSHKIHFMRIRER